MKKQINGLCQTQIIGAALSMLMMSSAVFANSQLVVDAASSLSAEELQMLPANSVTPDTKNAFRWWLGTNEPKTLNGVNVTSENGKKVDINSQVLEHNLDCYILMADTSGSMKKYWPQAKQALNVWVDALPEGNGFFGFAESFYPIVPLSSDLSKEDIKAKIGEVELVGKDTQLYLAVNEALNKTQQCASSRKHIVVFSDGDAEDKAYTLSEVVKLANQLKVSVHTVGFGDLTKSKTALKLEVLKTLSDKTNGQYHHFNELEEFSNAVIMNLNNKTLAGLISIDQTKLAYGTETLTLVINVKNESDEVEIIKHKLSITGTDEFKNILVSISQTFGGKNPWLIIGSFIFILVLLISLLVWIKAKNKRNKEQLEQQKLDEQAQHAAQQAMQNEQMKEALESVNAKIDAFKPEDAVVEKGTPYGWLKDNEGRYYDLVNYSSTIGRADDNDVVIKESHISGQHAILDFKKGKFIWTDRAPLNQTLLNNLAISGSAEIKPGDKIVCGKVELEFVLA